jgi:uncharacterized protein (TIGR02001 family)
MFMATLRAPFVSAWCMVVQSAVLPVHMTQADERWSASIGVSTDYVYRGATQSDNGPAVQAGVAAHANGWSAGAWASTVDVNRDGRSGYELDLNAMHAWSLHPDWIATVGVTRYEYLNDGPVDYDHDELSVSLAFQQRVTATIAWSPNTTRYFHGPVRGQATAYEVTFQQPLGERWSIFAGAGRYDLRDLVGYAYDYWSAGLTFTWASIQIDAAHINSNEPAPSFSEYEPRRSLWTGALSVRF